MHIPDRMGRQRRQCLLVLALALAGCGGGGSGDGGGSSPPPVEPVGSVIDSSLLSGNTGATYQIKVFLPQSYASGTALYPVIYATEGDAPFGSGLSGSGSALSAVSRFDTFKQVMQRRGTQAILVGIGGTDRRAIDFLLPGATRYLDFIVKELVPVIEAKYRVNPQRRALSGLSHGGYFVNAALFTEGMAGTLHFSHYLSTETSFGGHPNVAAYYAFEQQVYDAGKALPATLLLASGSGPNTNQEIVRTLYERMTARNYSGLALVKSEFPTSHVGADVPAFEDALARFFP